MQHSFRCFGFLRQLTVRANAGVGPGARAEADERRAQKTRKINLAGAGGRLERIRLNLSSNLAEFGLSGLGNLWARYGLLLPIFPRLVGQNPAHATPS